MSYPGWGSDTVDIFKRLKERLEGKDRRKLAENAVIIIIIGIIVIIAASTFFSGGKKADTGNTPVKEQQASSEAMAPAGTADINADRLEQILSRIQGVGRVEVMVTYVSGGESIPAYDTRRSESSTVEKDSGGGTRSVSQDQNDSSVVYEDRQGGGKSPVILKEMQPEVRGVVVVADGAGDPEVTQKISGAVQVLMDIPAHRIKILPMKK